MQLDSEVWSSKNTQWFFDCANEGPLKNNEPLGSCERVECCWGFFVHSSNKFDENVHFAFGLLVLNQNTSSCKLNLNAQVCVWEFNAISSPWENNVEGENIAILEPLQHLQCHCFYGNLYLGLKLGTLVNMHKWMSYNNVIIRLKGIQKILSKD